MIKVSDLETSFKPVSFPARGLEVMSSAARYDLLSLHEKNPERYPFLLESVADVEKPGEKVCSSRFDILFAFPQDKLLLDNTLKLTGIDNLEGNDFLENLSRWWQLESYNETACDEFPFNGGWFIFLAYELSQQIEHRLNLKNPSIPLAYAVRIPAAIIYDHEKQITYSICEDGYSYQESLLGDIENLCEYNADKLSRNTSAEIIEEEPTKYLNGISKVKKYIVDGDVFQVNLSRLWEINNNTISAADIYRNLRRENPAPFAGLANFHDFSVISSSPERLVKVKQGYAETRPIAGTRKRNADKEKDNALMSELISHPKERAEHIMLIDLERNDLGRICEPGSIEVDELMVLESYAHVHHIVSNVKGKLRSDILPGDILRAVFPGGTITGCPKERCMAIISELESEARGAYTGSMGFLNHNGEMDINILIRTMTLQADKLTFRAGAGLVADSDPDFELEETRHKARGLLLALKDELC